MHDGWLQGEMIGAGKAERVGYGNIGTYKAAGTKN